MDHADDVVDPRGDALEEIVARRQQARARRERLHRIGEGLFFAVLLITVLAAFVFLARAVEPAFRPGYLQ